MEIIKDKSQSEIMKERKEKRELLLKPVKISAELVQVEDIKEIYSAWSGGFIRGGYAMSEIGKILTREYTTSECIEFRDSDDQLIDTVKGVISLEHK